MIGMIQMAELMRQVRKKLLEVEPSSLTLQKLVKKILNLAHLLPLEWANILPGSFTKVKVSLNLKVSSNQFQKLLLKQNSCMRLNLLSLKVRYQRIHGSVKETLKGECKGMDKNGSFLETTMRVMQSMANGMGKARINIGMDKCMKEVGPMVYVMVKDKIDTQMEMFTLVTTFKERNTDMGHLNGKTA